MNFVFQEANTIVCQSTSLQNLSEIRHCKQEGLQPSLVALFKAASISAQKVLLLCLALTLLRLLNLRDNQNQLKPGILVVLRPKGLETF